MAEGVRFPTADELEQMTAAYEAEMRARHTNPLPPDPRDGDEDRAAAAAAAQRPPITERVYCPHCGKRFDQTPKQVALMMRGRHVKAEHAAQVEAY